MDSYLGLFPSSRINMFSVPEKPTPQVRKIRNSWRASLSRVTIHIHFSDLTRLQFRLSCIRRDSMHEILCATVKRQNYQTIQLLYEQRCETLKLPTSRIVFLVPPLKVHHCAFKFMISFSVLATSGAAYPLQVTSTSSFCLAASRASLRHLPLYLGFPSPVLLISLVYHMTSSSYMSASWG